MGCKFKRKKPRNILTAFVYRLGKLPFASSKNKFHIFSDLSWIFQRLSQEYSWGAVAYGERPARKSTLDYIKEKININDIVLDIGCNSGEITYGLSEVCKEATGIDYDQALIDDANTRFSKSNLSFICVDATKYVSKSDKMFDVMVCSHVLEHLEYPSEFLSSFKGYFKKLYIEVPDFDNSYINTIRDNLNLPSIYTDNDHVYEFSREDIEKIIRDNNLKILDCEFRYGVMRYWVVA